MPEATKDSFARVLDGLVRKYEADRDTYLSSQYNEAQTRSQFITPLLEALGWDVRNEAGVPYNLCEVLEEKGETHGRPDYTFRINGQTKFFLEAKKPSEQLHTDGIIQTKRYAWNSRDIFFAGVCDFEQFRFFDASLRPDDKRPLDGEAFHLIYNEYSSQINKLWELSRDRVAAGSLDQFLRKDRKSLLQKIPVDKDFLENLTTWRHDLANAIHARNPEHDAHALNEIVQRLLDRIIFIRIAEDRKVIDQRQLWDIAGIWEESGGRRDIMPLLVELFRDFNARFNGEIFKPHACEEIKIEGHVLSKIIRQLYPPKSNYRFDVIGVELLGSIYERYLGNTLRITPKRVFIEPKPEVRKAGGVYYTPQYIVDYIVKNTVGKLVEGKTPKEVDKIRILDPACGSGSFLIGAFQFLIDWYLNYYREHPKEAKLGTIFAMTRTDEDGNLRLSFAAKSLVLQHNLYGVDIDQQAVEVTMMSLYLKMLEGELGIQIPKQDKLPELKYNIRCGNSLIGPDIEKDKPLTLEERQRINPFDWNSRDKGFGDILRSGGFDAVIANPPYRMLQPHNTTLRVLSYLREHYVAAEFKMELFHMFLERGASLLGNSRYLSYIVPTTILNNVYAEKLRTSLVNECCIEQIAVAVGRVFADADVHTSVLVLRREPTQLKRDAQNVLTTERLSPEFCAAPVFSSSTRQSTFGLLAGRVWNISVSNTNSPLLQRLETESVRLEQIAAINRGLITGDRDKYFAKTKKTKLHVPILSGGDVHRYYTSRPSEFVFFKRPKTAGGCWDEGVHFAPHKLVVRQICEEPTASMLTESLAVTGNIFTVRAGSLELELYLLGILNSGLTSFYWRTMFRDFKASFPQVTIFSLAQLPIHKVDATDPRVRDKMAALVRRMMELNKSKHSDKLAPAELQHLEHQIAETDAEIDNLVYELYGITDEERKIIEGASAS